jgi:hypothetical protein
MRLRLALIFVTTVLPLFLACKSADKTAPTPAAAPFTPTPSSRPSAPAQLTLEPAQIRVLGTVTGRGVNFTPNASVTILGGTIGGPSLPLGTVPADSTGAFMVQTALPPVLQPGAYRITAVDPGGQVAMADLVVVAE